MSKGRCGCGKPEWHDGFCNKPSKKVTRLICAIEVDADFSDYKDPKRRAEQSLCGAIMGGDFIRSVEVRDVETVESEDE